MSGVDFTVQLALLLSLASAVLCVVYGLVKWNADDDASDSSSSPGAASMGSGGAPAAEDGS